MHTSSNLSPFQLMYKGCKMPDTLKPRCKGAILPNCSQITSIKERSNTSNTKCQYAKGNLESEAYRMKNERDKNAVISNFQADEKVLC